MIDENLSILRYAYKSAGFMISPRDFVFLSKVFHDEEKLIMIGFLIINFYYYILAKSLEMKEVPEKKGYVRG